MTDEIDRIVAGLSKKAKQVIRLLHEEYQPAPGEVSRQQTAWYAMRLGDLIEQAMPRNWADTVHYRLTPLGLAVRNRLQENSHGD